MPWQKACYQSDFMARKGIENRTPLVIGNFHLNFQSISSFPCFYPRIYYVVARKKDLSSVAPLFFSQILKEAKNVASLFLLLLLCRDSDEERAREEVRDVFVLCLFWDLALPPSSNLLAVRVDRYALLYA